MYKIVYSKKSVKDIEKLKYAKLDKKTKSLIELVRENPFKAPPPYEKLQGDLSGAYSRRINIKHRFVYEVLEEEKTIKILSMWTHYEF
ncbi:addiction module toxin [Clostridiales bacterium S5-A14a]|nr:addiction module toxin [Clostridiales bacterium S5-A14a]